MSEQGSRGLRTRPRPGMVHAIAALAFIAIAAARLRRRQPAAQRPGAAQPSSREWALLDRADAPDYDNPARNYMTRWRLISTPWFGIYVHRINQPDPRTTLHDHPWPFTTVILKGAYTEDFGSRASDADRTGPIVLTTPRTWRRWSVHRMAKTDAHAITVVHGPPVWTLVFAGRRHPEPSWGYWDENGYTPFDQHPHAQEFAAALAARDRQLTQTTTGDDR